MLRSAASCSLWIGHGPVHSLPKCYVEKVSFKSDSEMVNRGGLLYADGRGFQRVGLPWRKVTFQTFQATIFVYSGDIDPPNGWAVVVHI